MSINKFDGSKFTYWDSTNSNIKPGQKIISIAYDKEEDRVYFLATGTTTTNYYYIENNEVKEQNVDNLSKNFENIKITNFFYKNKNLYIICTQKDNPIQEIDTLYIIQNHQKIEKIYIPIREYIPAEQFGQPTYSTIYVDSKNFIWISSAQYGLLRGDLTQLLKPGSVDDINFLPDLWIRSLMPNPIVSHSRLNFFCVPDCYSTLTAKIYNCLGTEIQDVTKDIVYDATTASGTVDFCLDNNVARGVYYLNLKISTESRTILIIVTK